MRHAVDACCVLGLQDAPVARHPRKNDVTGSKDRFGDSSLVAYTCTAVSVTIMHKLRPSGDVQHRTSEIGSSSSSAGCHAPLRACSGMDMDTMDVEEKGAYFPRGNLRRPRRGGPMPGIAMPSWLVEPCPGPCRRARLSEVSCSSAVRWRSRSNSASISTRRLNCVSRPRRLSEARAFDSRIE